MHLNPLHNFWLKLGAVALALLLWVHVATNKTYEYQLDLPLAIINVPAGLVRISEFPPQVTVKIKATGKQLLLLATRQPRLTINAAEFKAGAVEKTITNSEVMNALDRSFENVEVYYPKSFVLKFEKQIERRLPVRSALKAEAARGYALVAEPQVEPETVTVTGPISTLHPLKYLETLPLRLSGLTAPITQKVDLALPDSLHLNVKDSAVAVRIAVEPRMQKTFADVAITPPDNFNLNKYQIVPSRLTLLLGIPQSKFDSITAADIAISFKRPYLLADTVKAAIQYRLPDNVEIVGTPVDSILIIRKS